MAARDHPDRRARFEATALPFMPSVYNTALRLSRRPEEARDLVQETFLRAYRTFDGFVPGTNCKAWLLTIVYSVFVNRYRQRRREPAVVPFDEAAGPGGTEGIDPHVLASIEGGDPEVRRALSALPEAFRSAVWLVDVEELSYEEAAAVLGCPVGTLRSRLFRGRKQLCASLRAYAERAGYLKKREAGRE